MTVEIAPMAPQPTAAAGSGDLSVADLLAELECHRGKALNFRCDGHDIGAGYHVTEVKAGAIEALDCGAEAERWHETVIQLLDIVSADACSPMSVATFLGIIGKVAGRLALDPDARLTFEVSDGRRALALYRATALTADCGRVHVELAPRAATCKPRDRWQVTQASACRPTVAAGRACCA